ncbi:SDR family oxidoreductase [Priestia koreensis]|uniref:glucose 1-dehydrogenase [NAD(P)(+)] n=1 Tax=Priestia koreensis TaxID=284581 RepID=A0A0M0LH71_9BACI|nr:SDR family oxidoreductase [Priestia koreensis]KOO50267.1 short-chain dehydrogenase [Priestia koreensis]
MSEQKQTFPAQHQDRQPGLESDMNPKPIAISEAYKSGNKLAGKTAIVTGGDSGIGRAVAYHYAKEGADVAIVYLNESSDAEETKQFVEQNGQKCLLLAGDIGDEQFCQDVVKQTLEAFGKIDILVNNAGEQHPQDSILDITAEQLEKTFRTNIFSMFHLTKAVLPHLPSGGSIINSSSITAYQGHATLIDYSSTKGAITTFTRSLSQSKDVIDKGIRVNAVAPGPIWTPLIPSTFSSDQVATFGADTPMKRAGQPHELAPSYVFLASDDSSYIAGQVIHVNGGKIVNG